jgi:uncharacterized protein YjdB
VEPTLSAITIAPRSSLTVGARAALSATGTAIGGDNLPALSVPIADPASHLWTSSDPSVVAVDARTGMVTAQRAGTAVVSVTSGGIAASTTITVTG